MLCSKCVANEIILHHYRRQSIKKSHAVLGKICFIDVASKIGSNKFVCAAENQRLEGILSGREKCWVSVGRFCENDQIWGSSENYVIGKFF